MYQQIKDIRVLKILQKAREFADTDLLNENLISQLISKDLEPLDENLKAQIADFLNQLINARQKASLSNK
ncbi:hypothetical protein DMB92_08645 [Campylobacter sp. MIT 99-7217]|uniref:hypothetical protein n=1 Tax=Campylobacter sp. MIT 99-7217 TaxID=535091 RepID=UPI00115958FB|nr:hypothetical protein [Campylobacter sp. MIT 99-7217]TQR29191.1 hypothetical protein DMB92_08645 [Campylobacter sp. MIT 99-7217]